MTLDFGNKCTVRTRGKFSCGWKYKDGEERMVLILRVLGNEMTGRW